MPSRTSLFCGLVTLLTLASLPSIGRTQVGAPQWGSPTPPPKTHTPAPLSRPQGFYIPPQHRVRVPGACMWECVESVGRTQGHTSVQGIAAHKKATTDGGARQEVAQQYLDNKKIPYLASPTTAYDYPGLKTMTGKGLPVIVGVQTANPPTEKSGHAVVVVRANNNKTTFWNPSAPNRLGTVSAGQFKKDWFGGGLVILPANRGGSGVPARAWGARPASVVKPTTGVINRRGR